MHRYCSASEHPYYFTIKHSLLSVMAGLIVEMLFMLFSVYNSVYSATGHELSYFHLRVLTKLNHLITIEKNTSIC